jgi:8-oxo-dGTP diphosphatase
MKYITVVAAVIIKDGQVFAAQRNGKGEVGFKWEFPGGKIEPFESNERALARELREELGIEAEIGAFLLTVHHDYQTFGLTMHCYLATISAGAIQLGEHLDSRWLSKHELADLDWAAADLPVVERVRALLGGA